MKNIPNCCAEVPGLGGWHHYQCLRLGPYRRKGKNYCWQHDPKACTAKHEKKQAEEKVARDADRVILNEGKAIIVLLGCGNIILNSDIRPVRRISMTFSQAEELAEKLLK